MGVKLPCANKVFRRSTWLGATPVLAAFVVTEIAGALYVVWPRRPDSAA